MDNPGRKPRSPWGFIAGQPALRLNDWAGRVLQVRHCGRRIEQAHAHLIRRLILFHRSTYPRELGEGLRRSRAALARSINDTISRICRE
jgi:hypothetical protein